MFLTLLLLGLSLSITLNNTKKIAVPSQLAELSETRAFHSILLKTLEHFVALLSAGGAFGRYWFLSAIARPVIFKPDWLFVWSIFAGMTTSAVTTIEGCLEGCSARKVHLQENSVYTLGWRRYAVLPCAFKCRKPVTDKISGVTDYTKSPGMDGT